VGVEIGPHPHIGLQTVTWLLAGELRHRDSLGTEQVVRPGQLNLMTAGAGVAHAEETLAYRGSVQGAQLWVAQPEATRHGRAAFEHHPHLPQMELGEATATVLVGTLGGATSPARTDSPLVGADLAVRPGRLEVPLDPSFEHALAVLQGSVSLLRATSSLSATSAPRGGRSGGEPPPPTVIEPGVLAYLGPGRDRLALECLRPGHVLVIGGEPFPEPVSMWWNFVARTHEEIDAAGDDWRRGAGRFGTVVSGLARVPLPSRPWASASAGAEAGRGRPAL
jgi:redox-sensitive bicupin YhaK (pirin superfamily)